MSAWEDLRFPVPEGDRKIAGLRFAWGISTQADTMLKHIAHTSNAIMWKLWERYMLHPTHKFKKLPMLFMTLLMLIVLRRSTEYKRSIFVTIFW